jgi:WD40 repeat protein
MVVSTEGEAVEEPPPPLVVMRSDRELLGHTHRITGLCWSPHHAARLVSASFDNTAQVQTQPVTV